MVRVWPLWQKPGMKFFSRARVQDSNVPIITPFFNLFMSDLMDLTGLQHERLMSILKLLSAGVADNDLPNRRYNLARKSSLVRGTRW